MLINHSDYPSSYVEKKLNLIRLAVKHSKKLTTFALLEEIIELQGQFCYTEAELQKYSNDILILKCQLLCKKLTEHTSDLIDYEITDKELLQFNQTIEEFQETAIHHSSSSQEIMSDKIAIQ